MEATPRLTLGLKRTLAAFVGLFASRRAENPKVPIHRDEAAEVFIQHCHQEADKLLASISRPLRTYCDGRGGRPSFDVVMSLPLLRFDAGQFKSQSADRGLIASHCYAIATATGLGALYHIDSFSQARVMEWIIYERIIKEDVGSGNVGRPPSPRRKPKNRPGGPRVVVMHVQWLPGTFEGGVPSLQKKLTDRYICLSASQKVVVLLMALKIIRPRRGVRKVLYHKNEVGGGIITLSRIGTVHPDPNDLDEWSDHLEITDADAALSDLPAEVVSPLIAAVNAIDPFWPTFAKSHRLTWQ